MNINELTIGQAKELVAMFGATKAPTSGLNTMIGKKCIIRTCSAGVWFGTVEQKAGNEVILVNARRMYYWWAAKGISLSAVALYGVNQEKSKIIEPVGSVWLEAIEIIPATDAAIKSIEGAPYVEAN